MIVSFETAVKLKEAGFPQPEPKRGQIWWYPDDYNGDVYGVIITRNTQCPECVHFDGEFGSDTLSRQEFKDLAFAPTATDILVDLGYNFSLSVLSDGNWFCDNQADESDAWQHENPAEACALAWLGKNKKTKKAANNENRN